jgi:sterol desaturase/sphingolipid hydroxylase (fatty acid hydroxylase superfamily)
MEQYLVSHEVRIVWLLFVATFLAIGLAETFLPRKALRQSTARRWAGNGLLTLTQIAVAALFPVGDAAFALLVSRSPYGLLNGSWLPYALRFAVAILLLDLLRYGVHYAFHNIRVLWRIHQVHHSDPDFDLTTGVRNHPGEVLITQAAYLAAVAVLAPPVLAVIAVEFVTGMQNVFSHANMRLPAGLEKLLRPLLITPDVHRIHHSDEFGEQNSNFGFLFPWWDRLFHTYRSEPALGHEGMGIGLRGFQDRRSMNPLHLLAMPFRRPVDLESDAPESTAAGELAGRSQV